MADSVVRCAVYTRKSSEEGLEQSFNSLHAQREACEAFITSQKHEGWLLVPTSYDDGGYSGGSMERPALKQLLADVEAGLLDTIIVYKVDRLTRSLADFAKIVERLDARNVSFVSVTQAFNTTTSMGRLTLNVLLSFAQFEREVTGERIRDKIAASKAKGMWMGGNLPLGYEVKDRSLVVHPAEAKQVRELFDLYLHHRAVDVVVTEAAARGISSKRRTRDGQETGGKALGRSSIYRILANPIYVGDIPHKGQRFCGQHQGIVEPSRFDAVQQLLERNCRKQGSGKTGSARALLGGLVFDAAGDRMTPTHTRKGPTRYRYYASPQLRLPASELERLVLSALTEKLGHRAQLGAILPDLRQVTEAVLSRAQALSNQLGGDDQSKRAAVLEVVSRVVAAPDHFELVLNPQSLGLTGDHPRFKIPVTIGRWKSRLSLVVKGGERNRPDPSLIAMVAQARRWSELLTNGSHRSFAEIAAADGVSQAYVRHTIGAAFLAPEHRGCRP